MFTSLIRFWVAAGIVVLTAAEPAPAQTNAPSTNAPPAAASAPAAPVPIPLPDVVQRAQDDTEKLKAFDRQTSPDILAQSVRKELPDLTHKVDERLEGDRRLQQSSPTLSNFQTAQTAWDDLTSLLNDTQDNLSARVRDQHTLLGTLNDLEKTWQATADTAAKSKAPAEIIQATDQIRARIAETRKRLMADLNDLYSLQVLIADQTDRSHAAREAIDASIALAQTQLFQQTYPRLWNSTSISGAAPGAAQHEAPSLAAQVTRTGAYLSEKAGALLVHAVLLSLLLAACFWIRKVTAEKAKTEPGLQQAAHVFNAPVTTALLLALLASRWLYPPVEAPRLFWALIGAISLVPAIIIVRRLISPELRPLLLATVVAFLVDQFRYALTPGGVLSRMVLLAEMIAVCVFVLVMLRRFAATPTSDRLLRNVRGYLHATFFVALAAGLASCLGYVPLAALVGNGVLDASYVAVVLYAAVRVLDALVIACLSLPPLSRFGMVRRHHDLVYEKTASVLRWLVVALWLLISLQIFSVRVPLFAALGSALSTPHSLGALHDILLGAILAFPLIVWAAFTLSRLIRFALEEDVYPNLHLPRGIPYAISTMIHYAILVVGFFMALSALGIDLGNYAVLAGAFGVGLGFGLQNIMNNFMSGLILLFERPIKVGDTVQLDPATIGQVERIGIRASVILLTNGAEMIVPNGNLISTPITNWTLSNCERLIEVPVNIAPKADPRRALEALVQAAKANSAVLKNPPPEALVVGLSATALSLKLRCWVGVEEDWMQIVSDLTLAILAALEKEQILLA